MDTDKLVFGIIGGITLLITVIIIATSFSSSSTADLQGQDLMGANPHRKGPETARVTIVEFSDFECPYCAQYIPIITTLLAQYPNDLSFIYRHYPIPSHTGAIPAARASEAAANQGKFWEYHDELFANQPNFAQPDLEQYAETLGLNMDQFRSDYSNADTIRKVQEDADYGRTLGVSGTPTFYVVYDGKVEAVALQQYSDLETKVKSILGESGSTPEIETPVSENEEVNGDANPDNTSGGPSVTSQTPVGMPSNLPMDVTLDIINVQRAGSVAPSQVSILSVESVEWSDSSLGCPKEDETYTQALVPGYKIMAEAGSETFEYHADTSGDTLILCSASAQ